MRILMLHPPLGARYGTEYVALELAAAWRDAGHDVTLAGHAAMPIDDMCSRYTEGTCPPRSSGQLPPPPGGDLSSPTDGMFARRGGHMPRPPLDGALSPINGAPPPEGIGQSSAGVGPPLAGLRQIRLPPLVGEPWAAFHMRSAEAPGLTEALRAVRPDRVFVVGLGPRSVNLRHLEIVAGHGIPVALWHHVAGITCQQHGLRYQDRTPCDGRVAVTRCARCRLSAAGVPAPIAAIAAIAGIARPGGVDRHARAGNSCSCDGTGRPGRRWRNGLAHLIAGRSLSTAFARYVAALSATVGCVFVGAEWVRAVMLINGFAPHRLALVRPGLRGDLAAALAAAPPAEAATNGPLRLISWGRLDDTKGLDTAIDAVRSRPHLDVRLDIAGDCDPATPYHDLLRRRAADDPRIRFTGRLETAELARALGAADVALLPSRVRETGPLTVFEAHAARLPVLGTAIGGIAELCGADPSVRLFGRGDAAALAALIAELAEDRGELARRRALVPPARTMREAAAECIAAMAAILPVRSDKEQADQTPTPHHP